MQYHTKARDNTKQIEEESVTFPSKVGYGYRMSAWYIMNNNYQNLSASDELHNEECLKNEYKTKQPIEEDIVEVSNDKNRFVDDPRKGARTLENNLIYSGLTRK